MSVSSLMLACAVLLLILHTGEGLKCYESSCLKEQGTKTLHCFDEDTSSMTLDDCTPSFFTQRWSHLVKEKLNVTQMRCAKLEGRGTLPKTYTGLDVIRMCVPVTQNMCETLSTMVSTKIKDSEVKDLRLHFSCDMCDTDGCNSAPGNMIPQFTFVVTAGIILLFTV